MAHDEALPLLGMVLVTHGRLAEEMVRAMEHVVGPQRAIGTVCIGPNDNMAMRRKEIADAIRKVDEGRGVRSEEHTSELQSLMRISYAVVCLKNKNKTTTTQPDQE